MEIKKQEIRQKCTQKKQEIRQKVYTKQRAKYGPSEFRLNENGFIGETTQRSRRLCKILGRLYSVVAP